jgi:hypothetical protein
MRKLLFVLFAAFAVILDAKPVSARAGIETRSAFVNYGLMMGKDPIAVPSGRVTFADWLYIDALSLVDFGDGNGKRSGYSHRVRKTNTSVGICPALPLYHFGVLTADLSYMYEYMPRSRGRVFDTQFIHAGIALEGRWLEPVLHIERDIVLDDGTYVNIELGHTFRPFDGFTVRPSIGQGFGDGKRTAGCFGDFDSAGLMDTVVRVDVGYAVTDWLSVGAFAAYHDFLFGDGMRGAAADFNGRLGNDARTWNFTGGLMVKVGF